MKVYIKTKVLFKFGSLEIVCAQIRFKSLLKKPLNTFEVSMYVHALTQCEGGILCRWIMKLQNVNVFIKTNILFKYGSLERLYMRSKKRFKLTLN